MCPIKIRKLLPLCQRVRKMFSAVTCDTVVVSVIYMHPHKSAVSKQEAGF